MHPKSFEIISSIDFCNFFVILVEWMLWVTEADPNKWSQKGCPVHYHLGWWYHHVATSGRRGKRYLLIVRTGCSISFFLQEEELLVRKYNYPQCP